jgi:glycosyltransferase involved in cell wall biosynthesis
MKPTVQVVVPVYNGERFLRECLTSILGQTYRDIQVIVVDNVSTDRSAEIVRSFQDPRIDYRLQTTHVGLAENLNRCIAYADSSFFCMVHADDCIHPEYVGSMVQAAERHPTASLLFSRGSLIDDRGQAKSRFQQRLKDRVFLASPPLISGGDGLKQLCTYNHLMAPAAFFRTERWGKQLRFDSAHTYLVDHALWLRALMEGHAIGHVYESLYLHRMHDHQLSDGYRFSLVKYEEFDRIRRMIAQSSPPGLVHNLLRRWTFFLWLTGTRDGARDLLTLRFGAVGRRMRRLVHMSLQGA